MGPGECAPSEDGHPKRRDSASGQIMTTSVWSSLQEAVGWRERGRSGGTAATKKKFDIPLDAVISTI